MHEGTGLAQRFKENLHVFGNVFVVDVVYWFRRGVVPARLRGSMFVSTPTKAGHRYPKARDLHGIAALAARGGNIVKCPIDGSELVMTDRQGVEIDYCPACRGVWLDRGELDKIIARAGALESPSMPSVARDQVVYRRDDDDDDRKRRSYDDDYLKRKKKKNIFEDIFDF
ncbi:MAG: zf-TFIIB domain-containing protein [Fimbriimonas sp.]